MAFVFALHHAGGVGPVGLFADLDLLDGATGRGGFAQAGKDAWGEPELRDQAPGGGRPYAEHPGGRRIGHSYAPFFVGDDDRFGGGFQDRLQAGLLALQLAHVVLELLGHVVEGSGYLADLVVALYGNEAVVAGGYPDRGVAGLREGARDLAREDQTPRAGQEHAGSDGPEDAIPQESERTLQTLVGRVVDEHSSTGPVRPHEWPDRHVARRATERGITE